MQRLPCFMACVCESHGHISCKLDQMFLYVDEFNLYLLQNSTGSNSRVHFDVGHHADIPGVISGLPVVHYLSVADNSISVVRNGVLKGMRLRELNLSHNIINSIESDVFQDLVSLRVLDLSHNRLTYIPKSVFSDLPVLEQLNLNNNHLLYFPLYAGSKLPQLKVLALGDNRLSYIMPGSLSSLSSLYILELNKNSLRTLTVDIKEEVPSLRVLNVSENPFHCSCILYGFHRLLNLNGSSNILMSLNLTTCNTPLSTRGKRISDVIFSLAECTEPESMLQYEIKDVLYDSNVEVVCDIRGDSDPAILWVTPWGHQFAHASHRPQLENVCETCKQDRVYGSRGFSTRSQVSVMNFGRILSITNYRSFFDGNITCQAFNHLGNSTAVREIRVYVVVQKIVHKSFIFGGFTAAGFLCFGLIVGSIKLALLACLKRFGKQKNVVCTPNVVVSDWLNEHDSLTMGDGDQCRHSANLSDDFYPPETPFTTPTAPSPNTSPVKTHSPSGQESPTGGWRPTTILDTMEEVQWRLRDGMGRKVETVKRNVQSFKASGTRHVQSFKESGSVYVHNIMESSSTAALKVKAGVVLGVETVKSRVQSFREFCGTGDMRTQTISMISMETNLDTNETQTVVTNRSVTFV